jgi:hypothetical protein
VAATAGGVRHGDHRRHDRPPAHRAASPVYRTDRPVRAGFGGYLQPAGLVSNFHLTTTPGEPLWFGERPPTPLVRFRIDYGHGEIVATHERLMIMAGWG